MSTSTQDSQVRRNAQGQRVREDILDAASRVMSLHGYEGASISAIMKESGIQKSSIYWQFDSKAAIAAAVMERGARRFFDAVTVKGTRGDAGARLRRSLREVAVLLDEHQVPVPVLPAGKPRRQYTQRLVRERVVHELDPPRVHVEDAALRQLL